MEPTKITYPYGKPVRVAQMGPDLVTEDGSVIVLKPGDVLLTYTNRIVVALNKVNRVYQSLDSMSGHVYVELGRIFMETDVEDIEFYIGHTDILPELEALTSKLANIDIKLPRRKEFKTRV